MAAPVSSEPAAAMRERGLEPDVVVGHSVGEFAALLVDQLTGPVRFTQAATELIRSGATTFVEVGPGNVLSGLVKRIDRGVKTMSVNSLDSLDRAHEALAP